MYLLVFTRSSTGGYGSNPKRYNSFRNLRFTPEVDLTLSSIPISEFSVDIVTSDAIPIMRAIQLLDDNATLFADYVVTKSERVGEVIRVVAQSEVALLDRVTMSSLYLAPFQGTVSMCVNMLKATYYIKSGRPEVYNGVFITMDANVEDLPVTGYFPEQSARERLQWVCLSAGVYVQQSGINNLHIKKVPSMQLRPSHILIPYEDTFMRPEGTAIDAPSDLTVLSYAFIDTVDENKQKVTAEISHLRGGSVTNTPHDWYYDVGQSFTYVNEDAEQNPLSTGQPMTIDGVMTIINDTQSDNVLKSIIGAYFTPKEWSLECINNGQYWPGAYVAFYTGWDGIHEGYIKSCDFSFGVQAKSQLVISDRSGVQLSDCAVIAKYIYPFTDDEGAPKSMMLGRDRYTFPCPDSGTATYTIKSPEICVDVVGDMLIFNPTTATTQVDISAGDIEKTIEIEYGEAV